MTIILHGVTYAVKYKKSVVGNYMRREVNLLHKNKIIGRFVIEGNSNHKNHFNSGNPCSMSINIDENHKKKGLSPIMIKYMIDNIKKDYPKIRDNQYLYIDADASGGFWNSIGMREHSNNEGEGYEKRITFKKLEEYVDNELRKDKYSNMIAPSRMRTRSTIRSRSPIRSTSRSTSRSRSRSHIHHSPRNTRKNK